MAFAGKCKGESYLENIQKFMYILVNFNNKRFYQSKAKAKYRGFGQFDSKEVNMAKGFSPPKYRNVPVLRSNVRIILDAFVTLPKIS